MVKVGARPASFAVTALHNRVVIPEVWLFFFPLPTPTQLQNRLGYFFFFPLLMLLLFSLFNFCFPVFFLHSAACQNSPSGLAGRIVLHTHGAATLVGSGGGGVEIPLCVCVCVIRLWNNNHFPQCSFPVSYPATPRLQTRSLRLPPWWGGDTPPTHANTNNDSVISMLCFILWLFLWNPNAYFAHLLVRLQPLNQP